ncbi:MAG: four helix bundle protein [Nitrospinae bacterium]|nr:four helix bundle protein [Nitrospinota bacterium]
MRIFELTKAFPIEERYALVDQIRRSSRSVCANLAEAWRRRRYGAAFTSKLGDSEAEAGVPSFCRSSRGLDRESAAGPEGLERPVELGDS